MTEEERREMTRNNYAAQMEMLGYTAGGKPKDRVEVVRCKDCKHVYDHDDGQLECEIKSGWFAVTPDWYCADGVRK